MPAVIRAVLLVLMAAGAVLAGSQPAGAHVELIGTDPGLREEVGGGFGRITLEFNGPLAESGHQVRLVDENNVPIQLQGEPRVEPFQLVIDVPDLEDGTYTVQYQALSGDGDNTFDEGSYEFTVKNPAGLGTALILGAVVILGGIGVYWFVNK